MTTPSPFTATATRLFPETTWRRLSASLSGAFRLASSEAQRLHASPVAKLIAALPFLAGCEEAERTAIVHLGTYLLSVRDTKACFNANPADSASVFERLRLIASFKGGDPAIIDRGMSLLALEMVSDYRRDADEDLRLGKYNPVASGEWDYDGISADLRERIEATDCPEMDGIMTVAAAPDVLWFI